MVLYLPNFKSSMTLKKKEKTKKIRNLIFKRRKAYAKKSTLHYKRKKNAEKQASLIRRTILQKKFQSAFCPNNV